MNYWSMLQEILAAGDDNRVAAGGKDLQYWRSPSSYGRVARVLSSAKDFVKDFFKNDEEKENE